MMTLQAGGATENPSPSGRTFVVVISPFDLSGELGLTVLWRSDVQRVMVTTVQAAIEVARVRPATMFVVGRRFDQRMDPTRTPRELAIQWANSERAALERSNDG